MGFPKTGKTKNVVESYPTPLLLLNFEAGGPDSVSKPIQYVEPEAMLESLKKKEAREGITCVDFSKVVRQISPLVTTPMNDAPIKQFILIVNALFDYCPFQTVVVDPYTNWDQLVNDYIGQGSPGLLSELKSQPNVRLMSVPQWGLARTKKREIIQNILTLDANVVFIGHVTPEKDELIGSISYMPSITGKLQSEIGAMFSQVVVAGKEGAGDSIRYVVYTQDTGNFKNLGARFASTTKAVTGPTFKELYGEPTK